LTLAAGTGLGLFNLAANGVIAQVHPTLRALLVERFARITAFDALVASPLLEEVTVRLFLMSVIAWVVFRVTPRDAGIRGRAHRLRALLRIAASVSSAAARAGAGELLSGRAHGQVHAGRRRARLGVLALGLPCAIACHVVVNATHILLERFVFQ
jgi:hypothetical protein